MASHPSGARIVALGVDLGGTWLRVAGVDRDGKVLKRIRLPSVSPQRLRKPLVSVIAQWNCKPEHLIIGSRSVWKDERRKELTRQLRSLASRVVVLSDVEIAWLAAFNPDQAGLVAISGTGSIVYGRFGPRKIRAGGLGPCKGDEGSGFWIGRAWMRLKGKDVSCRNRALVRKTALESGIVLAYARRGNVQAAEILRQAQSAIAELILRAASSLKLSRIVWSWGGAVMDEPSFQRGVIAELKRRGVSATAIPPRWTADIAAAKSFLYDRRHLRTFRAAGTLAA